MAQAGFPNGPEGVLRGIARWEIRDRAQAARRSIIVTARACNGDAAPAAVRNGLLAASACAHTPLEELQRFVCEYAYILGALGHDAVGVAEQALHALREAYHGNEPDAAVTDAVRRWCSDALPGSRAG